MISFMSVTESEEYMKKCQLKQRGRDVRKFKHVEEDNFLAPILWCKSNEKRKHLILKKNDYYRLHNQNASACVNRSPFKSRGEK